MISQSPEKYLKSKLIDLLELDKHLHLYFWSLKSNYKKKYVSIEDALLAVEKAKSKGHANWKNMWPTENTLEFAVNKVRFFREDQVERQVFNASWTTANNIFKQFEKIILFNEGDPVANYHTFLITDYKKLEEKFLGKDFK